MTNLTIRNQKKKQLILPTINQKGNLLIPIALFALLLIALYILFTFKSASEKTSSSPVSSPGESTSSAKPNTKTYTSKNLKISLEIPNDSEIEEQSVRVLIKNPQGLIQITKAGTQFDNLSNHLTYLDKINKITVSEQKDLTINTYPAKRRIINMQDSEELTYNVFTENRIYTLSTSFPSLYPTLDQIAQSFKYIP